MTMTSFLPKTCRVGVEYDAPNISVLRAPGILKPETQTQNLLHQVSVRVSLVQDLGCAQRRVRNLSVNKKRRICIRSF